MSYTNKFLVAVLLATSVPFMGKCQVKVMHDGTVNIGATTNPMSDLQVTGNALVSTCPSNSCASSCAFIRGSNGYSSATTPDYTWWYDDQTGLFHPTGGVIGFTTLGQERMRLAANGHLGIARSPDNLYKLDVNGNTRCNGGVWSASDRRFKLGVEALASPLTRVLRLKGVMYSYDRGRFPDMGFSDKKAIGFIAQDVAEILPEAVQVDEQGFYAMNYDMVVPLLVEAIKEQQVQIAEMKELLENCCNAPGQGALAVTGQKGGEPTEEPYLYQNVPNPYDERTVIACRIPTTVKQAKIMVYSASGELVRTLPVTGRGETQVNFQAGDLRAGAYFYALYTDDRVSPALQMLLTKR